jgi:antitoxin MazE
MHMQVTTSRWGNSLGIRIPKDIAERVGLSAGDSVDVEAKDGHIVISLRWPRYRLADLLVGMTPGAMHEAFDWGPDVGREIIDK